MNVRFTRNLPTVTEAEQAELYSRRVLLAGCGGLGGWLAEYLVRLGVGHITLVDGDCFAPSNLNRQLDATEQTLGQNKAEATAERLRSINRDAEIIAIPEYLTGENAGALLSDADVALDALDSVPARLLLEEACEDAAVPLVHSAIDALCGQVTTILPGMRTLRTLYRNDTASPASTLSFVPAYCAAVACAEALNLLLGRKPLLAGKLLVFDLGSLENTLLTLSEA